MVLFSTLILASAASASVLLSGQRISSLAGLGGLERQTESCPAIPAPYTCEGSCGPGYTECIRFPDCYNPSQGEICCSDGSQSSLLLPICGIHQLSSRIAFCAVGHYCTNVGCCSDINSLANCGAAVSLSTIPPSTSPASSSSTKSTSSIVEKTGSATRTTSSTIRTTESSRSTTGTTSSIAGTSSSLTTATQLVPQQSSSPLSTTTTTNSILSSAVSATTSAPSQKTANVAHKLEGGVFSFSLYGLSFLFLFL
jgi:hypothetical protein